MSMHKNKEPTIGDIIWMNFHFLIPLREPDIKQYGFIHSIYTDTLFFVTLYNEPQYEYAINLCYNRGSYWDYVDSNE